MEINVGNVAGGSLEYCSHCLRLSAELNVIVDDAGACLGLVARIGFFFFFFFF